MAIFLALGLGTVLALDRSTRSRRASVAVMSVLILGARSATGLAVTIMILVAWYVLVEYRARTGRWSVGYLAAAGAILLAVAGVTLSNAATIVGWFGRDMTLTGRTGIWAAVVPSIIDNPIVGYGRGGLFFTMNPDTVEILRRVHFTAYHAHSGVLDLLLQLGLVGLVLTAVVYGTMFVLGLQSPTRLGLWMVLLFVGQVSVSLSEATLVMPHVIWPAMTITAMLRLEQEQPGWAPVTRWTSRAT
jgi:O-antigen ligase